MGMSGEVVAGCKDLLNRDHDTPNMNVLEWPILSLKSNAEFMTGL